MAIQMCECTKEILRIVAGNILYPELIHIIVEYGHTFSVREYYDLCGNDIFIGRSIKNESTGAVSEYAQSETYLIPGLCDQIGFRLCIDRQCPNEIQILIITINKMRRLEYRVLQLWLPFWESIPSVFNIKNRNTIWQKMRFKLQTPPPEFNIACDYMLEKMEAHMYTGEKCLICPHSPESMGNIPKSHLPEIYYGGALPGEEFWIDLRWFARVGMR